MSLKTAAGRRDLALLPIAQTVLDLRRQAQAADRVELGRAWLDNGLIFTTRTGRPVEPRNLVRSFPSNLWRQQAPADQGPSPSAHDRDPGENRQNCI